MSLPHCYAAVKAPIRPCEERTCSPLTRAGLGSQNASSWLVLLPCVCRLASVLPLSPCALSKLSCVPLRGCCYVLRRPEGRVCRCPAGALPGEHKKIYVLLLVSLASLSLCPVLLSLVSLALLRPSLVSAAADHKKTLACDTNEKPSCDQRHVNLS